MDGIVVIDKPAGLTSHDVVTKVKKIVGARKVGHTGTLDPMATGVLPVCMNEATKLAQFLSVDNKTYLATMLLGVQTDTQDTEGKVIERSDKVVSEDAIREALGKMVGRIQQVPPAYSALKHQGKPLYKYARKGEFPEITAREVEIFSLKVMDISFPHATFEVSCSKGTYIRTLCHDVGNILGCGACLSDLRRLQSGFFTEAMAVSIVDDAQGIKDRILSKMLPLSQCLPALAGMTVDGAFADKLRTGFQPDVETLGQNVPAFLAAGDMIKLVDTQGQLVAVAEMILAAGELARHELKSQGARIIRVFNSNSNKD
jgi:tRNA pseudouridine55 synthase